MFKKIIRNYLMTHIFENYSDMNSVYEWYDSGKKSPPPHKVKQFLIKEYAVKYNISVFIETGTYMGDMIFSIKSFFKKIYTIELSDFHHKNAVERFKDYDYIKILHGDSSSKLLEIPEINLKECLFWLDGHYSAGNTAKGSLETPILAELEFIFKSTPNHIIIIDDARCFNGENDYPTISNLESVYLNYCEYILVKNDAIIMKKIKTIIN